MNSFTASNPARENDHFHPVLAERLGSVEESFIRELVQVYRAHEPCIEPFPECREALEPSAASICFGDYFRRMARRSAEKAGCDQTS